MKFIKRLGYGIFFAVLVMIVVFVVSLSAASAQEQVEEPHQLDCKECHPSFYEAWETSGHGMSTTDPVFLEAWENQGSPGQCLTCHATGYDPKTYTWEADGVVCETCHYPVTATHPLEPMGIQYSAEMCGSCHTETHFEWQVSAHRQEGLECIGCHDPHQTSLKMENSDEMCSSCHTSRAENFTHSAHSRNGLTCADCHLGNTEQEPGDGHGSQDHSFYVSLSTCTQCHAYQLHDPEEVHPAETDTSNVDTLDAMASVEQVSVIAEPKPVSPVGFSTVAGMVGVAFGIIIAPWLERWRKNFIARSKEDN